MAVLGDIARKWSWTRPNKINAVHRRPLARASGVAYGLIGLVGDAEWPFLALAETFGDATIQSALGG